MSSYLFESRSEQDTDRLGATLEAVLPQRAVIGLQGTLGAGKTRLVQAIAGAAGIDRKDVTSPTFVLCQEYHGRRTLYHLDAYRIADEDEFLELAVDEMFQSDGLVFVEWSDRVASCLPPAHIEILITTSEEGLRQFNIVDKQTEDSSFISALETMLGTDAAGTG